VTFLKNLLVNLSGRLSILVVALCIEIVVARSFGPIGKGHYAILIFWASTITTVFHLGFSRACIYFYQQETEIRQNVLNITVLYTVCAGTIFAIAGNVVLARIQSSEVFNIPTESLRLLLLLAPALLSILVLSNINRAFESYFQANLVVLMHRVGVLLAIGCLVVLQKDSTTLVYAIVVGAALANCVGWYSLLSRFRISLRNAWFPKLFRRMFSYGLRAVCFNIVTLVNTRIDHLIIGSILGLEQLGFYSAAVVLAELTNKLITVLAEVMFPRSSALVGEKSDRFTALLLRITIAFSLLFLLLVGVFADTVISVIFGSQFIESKFVLWLLLPSSFFVNVILVMGTDLSGRGRPGAIAIASFVGLVMIVAGNMFFAPRYGIQASAIVAVVSNFVTMLTCMYFHVHVSTNSIRDIAIIKKQDISLLLETIRNIRGAIRFMHRTR